jgi:hypothetical protein
LPEDCSGLEKATRPQAIEPVGKSLPHLFTQKRMRRVSAASEPALDKPRRKTARLDESLRAAPYSIHTRCYCAHAFILSEPPSWVSATGKPAEADLQPGEKAQSQSVAPTGARVQYYSDAYWNNFRISCVLELAIDNA